MATVLTPGGLERKRKEILNQTCAKWDVEPDSLGRIGEKLAAEILATTDHELKVFEEKMIAALLGNSLEARLQIQRCNFAHVWVAPGTNTRELPALDLSFLPAWATRNENGHKQRGVTIRSCALCPRLQ